MFLEKNKPISNKVARIVVFGNEKGGTGKTTAAFHVAIGLLKLGFRVATIDLDANQASFTRYLENRKKYASELLLPEHIHIKRVECRDTMQQKLAEQGLVRKAIDKFKHKFDYIIIDTPGSDTYLSIVGHSYADTIVTPMNDSFVDMDLLARFDGRGAGQIKPSLYSSMIWDLRSQREKRDGKYIDWIVMRNRLGHLHSKNKNEVGVVLNRLSRSLGFRLIYGFGERVIFRELFLEGKTLFDIKGDSNYKISISNITARQEVRSLVKAILPEKSTVTMALLQTA